MNLEIHDSWKINLKKTFDESYFHNLIQFVQNEYHLFPNEVFPLEKDIFRAFNACPFDELKVVILGQDPYPTPGHAHGLCFSCDESVKSLPKSLANIFKEYASDLAKPAPKNGDLNHWAKQGVLLLNSFLTVRKGAPLSHANKGWEKFTDEVIQLINDQKESVIFVLWGAPAQTKGARIDKTKHVVLTAPHPSPLSAYRGFFGSKPFSTINRILMEKNQKPIQW